MGFCSFHLAADIPAIWREIRILVSSFFMSVMGKREMLAKMEEKEKRRSCDGNEVKKKLAQTSPRNKI